MPPSTVDTRPQRNASIVFPHPLFLAIHALAKRQHRSLTSVILQASEEFVQRNAPELLSPNGQ